MTSVPPNDADFFLLGKTDLTRDEARALTPIEAQITAAADQPSTGHTLDLVAPTEFSMQPTDTFLRSLACAAGLALLLAGCSRIYGSPRDDRA